MVFLHKLAPRGALSSNILCLFQSPATAVPAKATLCEKIRQLDGLGIILTISATTSYTLALQYGGVAYPWNSATVISLLVGFLAIASSWVVVQYLQKEFSMVSPRLALKRTTIFLIGFVFFLTGGFRLTKTTRMYQRRTRPALESTAQLSCYGP